MTKIGTFFVAYVFGLVLLFFFQPFLFLFGIFIVFLPFFVGVFTLKKIRQKQFHKEFLLFLSQLLLRMRMGESFRSSYEECLQAGGWKYPALLWELYENVAFMSQKKPQAAREARSFLDQVQKVFCQVDQSPTNAIRLLDQYKNDLFRQVKFRRRSRQIWTHVMTQGLVVLLLYLGLLVYTLQQYSFSSQRFYILVSFLFFAMAAVSFLYLRKEPQWDL